MSCFVLDIELADKNVIRELGVFIDGKVQSTGILISSSEESTNPQNKPFGAQETCTELCGRMDVWITVSFQTLFLEL